MTKIQAEIDFHIGQDRILDEQDLHKLDYLTNAINDALRLYAPVPLLVPHEASEDCAVGGYDVQRRTMLMVNALAIHRKCNEVHAREFAIFARNRTKVLHQQYNNWIILSHASGDDWEWIWGAEGDRISTELGRKEYGYAGIFAPRKIGTVCGNLTNKTLSSRFI
ncbi:hypothetical protein HYC85_020047 [Camellia sinensis]|uniref:Cytochrome P450 n=1 Tax=Camellia sinensis TaxID=4442 RepID=A0A7J7GQD0_CAMSI|nr:hypothetical protein HYC85_020047 [Camellia sinensis]